MKRRVFLHIGQGKTGTSTIQGFLKAHRERLLEQGYLYPWLTPSPRHMELSLYGKGEAMVNAADWWRVPWQSPAELRRAIEVDLPAQILESGCPNVVLSDEGLYRRRTGLRAVLDALASVIDEPVFVVYLRRQDDHIVSRYKQTMREGGALLLSEFIARPQALRTWRYDLLLTSLRAAFPEARLVVRPYDRAHFKDQNLVHDFLDAIELTDLEVDQGGDQIIHNTSYDACTTEYLRRHNALHGRAERSLRRRLTTISDGPDLRMEDHEHLELWSEFVPGNELLVEEFMPGTEDVFLAPPKRRPGITQAEVTDEDLARIETRLTEARRTGPPERA